MRKHPLSQIVIGVIIVAVGVIALLGQTGVIDAGALIGTWWPMLVVALGLAALIAAPRAWIGPLLVVAVGVGLQLNRLEIIDVNLWGFLWPVLIILVGLGILFHLGPDHSDASTVNSAVIWWGADRSTTSQDFRGGSLSAIMGGIDLDLREAEIVTRADISVFVWWGGVEIKVPPTWRVRVDGLPLLGGWENKTATPKKTDGPELVVHVTAVMGGVEIHH